ncbi:DNA polymerase Y family protein [Rhizomicrobium electricum]|uniref:DNA-directed DNA polymerase n=2 Tax=Rhizomicrobium electricum TaxID=480070 RepID=A0ABN1EU09_9PROT|nr:protein ImuB [Rhizomicrobium electricum]
MRLTAVDRRAADLGLAPGMALASARAMVPAVKVMAANAPADLRLLEKIADWCDSFTPLVALDAPCGLLLDVTGASHLFDGEQAMLDRLRRALKKQGFAVAGALAGTALAARALARYRDGTVVPPGRDSEAVSTLPVEALDLDPVTVHAFRRAGLKTVGQVAGRRRAELTARFGSGMVFALDTALGRADLPISPRLPLPDYRAERRFAEPVTDEKTMLATLNLLAGRLGKNLEERGEGARALQAVFFRADGSIRRLAVQTGAPTREPALIERLFREKLDALADPLDPGFGFDLIRLEADRTEPCRDEAAALGSETVPQKEIRALVDRLTARFGAHRVLSFEPRDTHIPENAFAAVPAQYARAGRLGWEKMRSAGEAPCRPLRLLAPEPVSLIGGEAFRWRHVTHRIRKLEGPERIAMEWWRDAAPDRDYYRAEDENGRRFWLYREQGLHWFLHGVFA